MMFICYYSDDYFLNYKITEESLDNSACLVPQNYFVLIVLLETVKS